MEETYGLIVDSSGTRYKTNPYKKDTDDDGLKDNEEISNNGWCEKEGKDHYGNRIYKRYHHMNSDPTKQDSDGDGWSDSYEVKTSKTNPLKADTDDDGIIDKEDNYPLSPLFPFVQALKKIKKIVDEFKSSINDSEESKLQHEEYLITKESPNYIITMNILRGLKYGSENKGDVDCLEWQLTSGSSYSFIRDYINKKDSSILQFFYKTYYNMGFLDPDKQTIDFLHMLATLSAYCYPKSIVKDNIELA